MREVIIGVPPGIGDIYWVLTKLESLKERENIDRISLCIADSKSRDGSNRRSADIDKISDLVDECFYGQWNWQRNLDLDIERDVSASRTEDHKRINLDYVLFANGHLEKRGNLSEYLPEYKTNLDIKINSIDSNYDGVVYYPSSASINSHWLNKNERFWAELINKSEYTPIIIGAGWDADFWEKVKPRITRDHIDLVNKTNLMEVMGILKNARAVVGAISGMTIMANHFRRPTVSLCPDKFRNGFEYSWVDDVSNYQCVRASNLRIDSVLTALFEVLDEQRIQQVV